MFLRELARRASMGRREGAATAAASQGGGDSSAGFAASPPRAPLLGGGGAGRPAGAPPASPGQRVAGFELNNPAARAPPEAAGPPERGPLIRGVGACEEANPRFRPSHEDAHSVDTGGDGATGAADAPCEPPHGALFGVYDGHGGADVARFAAEGLHLHCRRQLAQGQAPSAALVAAYLATDAEVAAAGIAECCGCTAVTAHVARGAAGVRVCVANAGDARCLLVRLPLAPGAPAVAEALSVDHVPSLPAEAARIAAVGGVVARGRVLGVLAVSRALGDVCLKPSVTPQPHVAQAALPVGQRACLLLFCDGVSGVCSDTEAAQCVADALAARATQRAEAAAAAAEGGPAAGGPAWDGTRAGGGDDDAAAAAEALVAEAMRRGTRDNVTVLAVLL